MGQSKLNSEVIAFLDSLKHLKSIFKSYFIAERRLRSRQKEDY